MEFQTIHRVASKTVSVKLQRILLGPSWLMLCIFFNLWLGIPLEVVHLILEGAGLCCNVIVTETVYNLEKLGATTRRRAASARTNPPPGFSLRNFGFIDETFPYGHLIYDQSMFQQHGHFEPGCVNCFPENATEIPHGLYPDDESHFENVTGQFF